MNLTKNGIPYKKLYLSFYENNGNWNVVDWDDPQNTLIPSGEHRSYYVDIPIPPELTGTTPIPIEGVMSE